MPGDVVQPDTMSYTSNVVLNTPSPADYSNAVYNGLLVAGGDPSTVDLSNSPSTSGDASIPTSSVPQDNAQTWWDKLKNNADSILSSAGTQLQNKAQVQASTWVQDMLNKVFGTNQAQKTNNAGVKIGLLSSSFVIILFVGILILVFWKKK